MKTPAKSITVKITESDRAKAGAYYDNQNCILCQTLKRLKFRAEVQGTTADINGKRFLIENIASNQIARAWSHHKWMHEIVGLKVKLTRIA